MAWSNPDSTYQSFTDRSPSARVAGTPELLSGTVVVPLVSAEAGEDVTVIYEAHEYVADKLAATAIVAGALVRVATATGTVNVAVAGAANVACGFSREAVTAAQALTKIKIRFDGRPRGA